MVVASVLQTAHLVVQSSAQQILQQSCSFNHYQNEDDGGLSKRTEADAWVEECTGNVTHEVGGIIGVL